MMVLCFGKLMTSSGMNWEQKGSTLRSTFSAWYSFRTSGTATFFTCQRLYLNTGTFSDTAAWAVTVLGRTVLLSQDRFGSQDQQQLQEQCHMNTVPCPVQAHIYIYLILIHAMFQMFTLNWNRLMQRGCLFILLLIFSD